MKGLKTAVIAHKKPNTETLKTRKPTKEKVSKKTSKTKDPEAPKRPPTAFLLFMEEFRKTFKKNSPDNKSISVVSKAGGEKWKSMTTSEKAPYMEKALKRKTEYEKARDAYEKKKKLNNEDKGKLEESGKSSSEVNDENDQEASS